MKILTLLVFAQLTLHAAPDLKPELAVFERHFSNKEIHRSAAGEDKPDVPIVLKEQSSIGRDEPGRDWKGPLRKSAEKQGESDVREAVEDFIAKNESSSSFANLVLPRLHFVVVTEVNLRAIFSDRAGWDLFRQKFNCSSIHSLSRVGFSKNGRVALYFASVQHDWLDGYGEFHVMRKKDEARDEDRDISIGWSFRS